MTEPRKEVIVALVDAMLDAMKPIVVTTDANASEVFSAMMSCAGHAVDCAVELGADMTRFRDAFGELYAKCGEIPAKERN